MMRRDFILRSDKCLEDEECRLCLNQGILRKCCNHYYCRECYFRKGDSCPGCNEKIIVTNTTLTHSAYIFLCWTISLFVISMLFGCMVLIAQLFTRAPQTIWGSKCFGWFQHCNRQVCVEMGSTLEMPNFYHLCSEVESVNKVLGEICIFDDELYKRSNSRIGYDFCLLENDSLIIFEDTFDLWKDSFYVNATTTGTASSKWARIENGRALNICGSNNISKPGSMYNLALNPRSLTFSGVNFRFAETIHLDVSFGGQVDFYLKMAPILSGENETPCKSSFDGDVFISYSIDNGTSWNVFAQYPVVNYRNATFTKIVTSIPTDAWTNHTRIKWEQPYFDPLRDFWALDDVRIFRNFPPHWRTTNVFQQKASARSEEVQRAQCCLDTDQCRSFPNLNSYRSGNHCERDYLLQTPNLRYHFKKVDLIILIASLLSFVRFCYGKLIDTLEKFTEMNDKTGIESLSSPSQRSIFIIKGQKSWRIFSFAVVILPFLVCTILLIFIFIHESAYTEIPSNTSALSVTAVTLDFFTVKWTLRNIFHFWPFSFCPHIYVDSFCDSKIHYLGSQRMFMTEDVKGSVPISKHGCWIVFLLVVIGAIPMASITVLLRPAIKYNEALYLFSLYLVGSGVCIRSILGPSWALKIVFSSRWLLSYKSESRRTMALSLQRAAKIPLIEYSVLIAMIIFAVIIRVVGTSLKAGYVILIVGAVIMLASFVGLTVGLLQGLPICPDIHLTNWPKADGYAIFYQRYYRLPCILTCTHCTRLQSCSIFYLVQVNGDEYFASLQGLK